MSVTNIIDDPNVTIVQGVNGIRLCEEGWMTQRRNHRKSGEKTKETIVSCNHPEEQPSIHAENG